MNRLFTLFALLLPMVCLGQSDFEADSVEVIETVELTFVALQSNNFNEFEKISVLTVSCQFCSKGESENNNLPLIPKQFFELYQSSEQLKSLFLNGINAETYTLQFSGTDRTVATVWYSIQNENQRQLGRAFELYLDVFRLAGVELRNN